MKKPRLKPVKRVHYHHAIPLAENIDWHLANLWETPSSQGGYRTLVRMTPKGHYRHHKKLMVKVRRSRKKVGNLTFIDFPKVEKQIERIVLAI